MDNTKKLGLILSAVVLVIIIILAVYFTTFVFKIKNDVNITTTTTKKIDAGFNNLTENEQINLNRFLNDENLLIAFNNAFDNNYEILNVNLFETEQNKFKFIYTTIILNQYYEKINYEILNNYSKNIFNTELYESNFIQYLNDDYYNYEIKYQDINYCLKAYKKNNNKLLIDMIEKNEVYCKEDYLNYSDSIVLHKIELKYTKDNNEINNNDYKYESFVVIR